MVASADDRPVSPLVSAGWCLFYASGVIGTLLVYGVVQERVMTHTYGSPPVMFGDSVFLVFLNRVFAVAFALIMVTFHGEPFSNKAPLWKYGAISFSNVYASTCQYEALKYVSFPVQMLGKSFKMMPVMVWGMIVAGKRYTSLDWGVALCVTGGVTECLLTGPIVSGDDKGNSSKGLALLALFLFLDGFTSTMQEKLFKQYTVTKYNQMLYVNLGSVLLSSITLFTSGGMVRAIAFCQAYPAFMYDASIISTSALGGQWFIYSQIKEFGALVFAATMNVRQVVSIIVSYIQYGHSITMMQVIGLCGIFGSLFYKSYIGFMEPAAEKAPLVESKTSEVVHENTQNAKV